MKNVSRNITVFTMLTFACLWSGAQTGVSAVVTKSTPPAGDGNIYLNHIFTEMDLAKTIEQSVTAPTFLIKNIGPDKDPAVQKKIEALKADTNGKLNAAKAQKIAVATASIKKIFLKTFSVDELKYLDAVLSYAVFKKYKSLVESEEFLQVLSKQYLEGKVEVDALKLKIAQLKKTAPEPTKK